MKGWGRKSNQVSGNFIHTVGFQNKEALPSYIGGQKMCIPNFQKYGCEKKLVNYSLVTTYCSKS